MLNQEISIARDKIIGRPHSLLRIIKDVSCHKNKIKLNLITIIIYEGSCDTNNQSVRRYISG